MYENHGFTRLNGTATSTYLIENATVSNCNCHGEIWDNNVISCPDGIARFSPGMGDNCLLGSDVSNLCHS
jgi:hypothetical protein